MGAPLAVRYWSAALLDGGVDLRHGDLLLDLVDPVVMDRVGLGRSGETEDRSVAGLQQAAKVSYAWLR
jgi:hypothetical protein